MAEEPAVDLQSPFPDPPMARLDGDGETISDLQRQLEALKLKVEELEMEKKALLSQLSSCRCRKYKGDSECSVVADRRGSGGASADTVLNGGSYREEVNKIAELEEGIKAISGLKKKKKSRNRSSGSMKAMHHHPKRYVALKVMYFGPRFYGFASEAQMDPTVEVRVNFWFHERSTNSKFTNISEIFKALQKTRLLVGDKVDWQYSRCGRTDKGVSSTGQVIALFVRSNFKDAAVHASPEGFQLKESCDYEIDYVGVLNKVLPKDIRIIGWCPAPADFHARFSCLSREYKYLFWKKNLDITVMKRACKIFIGEHDFRNFCKMDAVNVHNYRRRITSFDISACNERFDGDQLWALTIKGSAFLWHQVRCMVAVLFMIGQGLEPPTVIDALLDTEGTVRKPQYVMAPELPLILQTCEFEGLNFICSQDAAQVLQEHLINELKTYKLQAAIFMEGLMSCSKTNDENPVDQSRKKRTSHIPLMSRPTEPSYDERRAKFKARTEELKA